MQPQTMLAQPPAGPASDAPIVLNCSDMADLIKGAMRDTAELSILSRAMSPDMCRAFAELDLGNFADIRLRGSGARLLSSLSGKIERLGWPRIAVEQILDDVSQAIAASADGRPDYMLRLEHVTDDACRKFHKDRTDIRLITTYCGRGSQWMDAASPDIDPPVHELAPFHMAAFQGKRRNKPQRILHRSPPLGPLDKSRLLLVLDIERPGWEN